MAHARRLYRTISGLACAVFLLGLSLPGQAETPQQILNSYQDAARTQSAGFSASSNSGGEFFRAKHGKDWSCSSCHTNDPTATGKHIVTGKTIQPMAVATNPERLTRPEKVEKWLTRNCKDVLGRECTAAEKADVLAFLIAGK